MMSQKGTDLVADDVNEAAPATDDETPPPEKRGIGALVAVVIGKLVSELFSIIGRGIDSVITWVTAWLVDAKRARYGLSITRILLGFTGIGMLATNFRTRLYAFGSGSVWNTEYEQPISDFPNIGLFSLFHKMALNDTLFTVGMLGLGVLAVLVMVGWRTKIIMPVFFVMWVSFIEVNDALGDQGDNMYRITLLTLLFADTASVWSLDAKRRQSPKAQQANWFKRGLSGGRILPEWLTNPAHNLALVIVATHVSMVYASGALYKAGGQPWQQGYAIYNPLHTMRFGPWPELSELFTTWGPMVAAISWSSVILQMAFPMMLLNRATRVIALLGIGGFHVGIAVLMGLPWFSLAMIAIDAIFIRDVTWKGIGETVKRIRYSSRYINPEQGAPQGTLIQVK